jgi:glycerol-3-phosphate dehydrogenase
VATDNALDAKRRGATISNYTEVIGLDRQTVGSWRVAFRDALDPSQHGALIAKIIINTAGPWIDLVNRMANPEARSRTIGTKGAHIVVRLPDSCRNHGLVNIMRDGMPGYLVPWRQTHHFGPTDTPFDGDLDDICASKTDVEFLLDELNHILPGAGITSRNLVGTWAGVRPWTNEVQSGKKRVMHTTLHDMASDGMEGVFALTGASITSHRASAKMIVKAITRLQRPSRPAQLLDDDLHAPITSDDDPTPFLNNDPTVSIGRLRDAARDEEVRRLSDLLLRRTGVDYAETKGIEAAQRAADMVAPVLGWDNARVTIEVDHYRSTINRLYGTLA